MAIGQKSSLIPAVSDPQRVVCWIQYHVLQFILARLLRSDKAVRVMPMQTQADRPLAGKRQHLEV